MYQVSGTKVIERDAVIVLKDDEVGDIFEAQTAALEIAARDNSVFSNSFEYMRVVSAGAVDGSYIVTLTERQVNTVKFTFLETDGIGTVSMAFKEAMDICASSKSRPSVAEKKSTFVVMIEIKGRGKHNSVLCNRNETDTAKCNCNHQA